MKKILSVLFAILAISTLSAQVEDNTVRKHLHKEKTFTLATHPLYHFNNGVRLDFEKRIKNSPAWVQIGLSGYLLTKTNSEYNRWIISGDEINHFWGSGIDVNYKYFFNRAESLYFAGGCSYTHHNIEYFDRYWNSYTDEYGLMYLTREYMRNVKQKIDKLGTSVYFGYQIPTSTFLFDMFVGMGYRYSFRNNGSAKPFDDSMISLGYRGVVFITGVRLGVKFKQK
jgi:hypothetical protein